MIYSSIALFAMVKDLYNWKQIGIEGKTFFSVILYYSFLFLLRFSTENVFFFGESGNNKLIDNPFSDPNLKKKEKILLYLVKFTYSLWLSGGVFLTFLYFSVVTLIVDLNIPSAFYVSVCLCVFLTIGLAFIQSVRYIIFISNSFRTVIFVIFIFLWIVTMKYLQMRHHKHYTRNLYPSSTQYARIVCSNHDNYWSRSKYFVQYSTSHWNYNVHEG